MIEAPPDETTWAWLADDAVARQARARPSQLACIALIDGRRLTYAELDAEVGRCAGYLRGALSGPGARVAVLGRNSLRQVLLFYACMRVGAIYVPLNWRLSAPEIEVIIDDCRPELFVHDAEFAAAVETAGGRVAGVTTLSCGPDADPLADLAAAAAYVAGGGCRPLEPCTLLYTSGTTGKPKGVVVTPRSAFVSAYNFSQVGVVDSRSAMLLDAPMFHVLGLLAILHCCVTSGGVVLVSERFDPGQTLKRISDPDLKVTHFFGAPQMARLLCDHEGFAAADLSRLTGVFTGGAPLAPSLVETYLARGVVLANGYGMTETGTALGMPVDPVIARAKINAAGLPGPAMDIRLVDPEGRDVADGEIGEIWMRGPGVTPGYWGRPEITAKAFAGAWFKTGDAGMRDADGFYYLVDRWKDMYITGGENVYPAEIEGALAACVHIADCAVIGVPDDRWGESGCAYVALRHGAAAMTAEAVIAHCAERLARYKLPRWVRFVEAIPRSAAGKVLKDDLRRAFAAETASSKEITK